MRGTANRSRLSWGDFIEHIYTTTINKNIGLFDNFTADGFLACFNRAICSLGDNGSSRCLLRFICEAQAFAQNHFEISYRTVHNFPDVPVDMGVDLACVRFQYEHAHLVRRGMSRSGNIKSGEPFLGPVLRFPPEPMARSAAA